jgi:hypothetical protein
MAGACECGDGHSGFVKCGKFLDIGPVWYTGRNLLLGVSGPRRAFVHLVGHFGSPYTALRASTYNLTPVSVYTHFAITLIHSLLCSYVSD